MQAYGSAKLSNAVYNMLNGLSVARQLGGIVRGSDIKRNTVNWARGDMIIMPAKDDSEIDEMLWHVSVILEVSTTAMNHKVCFE